MMRHSMNNNTCMGLIISLCLNSSHLISLPQILDIYSVVALYPIWLMSTKIHLLTQILN